MPIYLYIKTHNKTGLKYLGQTSKKDPHAYPGSGKYWKRHLKKHGNDYTTEIIKECNDWNELRKWGLHYSELFNVVESNDWANLIAESGEGRSLQKKNFDNRPKIKKIREVKHNDNRAKRPICQTCQQRPVSINYIKNGKTYYRSKCDSCIRQKNKIKPAKPNWAKDGYKKKMKCDRCGFSARWGKQIVVYYVDGDMNNTQLSNLKSICLNCSVAVDKQDMPWKRDLGLNPDN